MFLSESLNVQGSVLKFNRPDEKKALITLEVNADAISATMLTDLYETFTSVPNAEGKPTTSRRWMFDSVFKPSPRFYGMGRNTKRIELTLCETGLFDEQMFPNGLVASVTVDEEELSIKLKNKLLKESNLETCVLTFQIEIPEVTSAQVQALSVEGTNVVISMRTVAEQPPDETE